MDDFDDSSAVDERAADAKRVLCVDESCTGTMGSDGRCRVCGTLIETDVRFEMVDDTEVLEAEPAAENGPEPTGDSAASDSTDDDDWHLRELCPDESCIGTLGEDGRCRVCGQSKVTT